jgi:hypothetical protein
VIPPETDELEIYGGVDFEDEWWWIANGSGVDFTGCSATFSLRVVPSDETPIVTVTDVRSAPGWIELGTGENAGLVRLHLYAAATSAFVYPVAHGNLVLTMSDGSTQLFQSLDARIYPQPNPAAAAPPPEMPVIPPASTQLSYDSPDVLVDTTVGDVHLVWPVTGIDGKVITFAVIAGAHKPVLHTGDTRLIIDPEDSSEGTTFTPDDPAPGLTFVGGIWAFRWSAKLGKVVQA